MKETEMEGKTVTMAVENGLKELGLRRDQVEVQVLDEGSAGFLGLGVKPARVRLREKTWRGDAPEKEPGDAGRPPAPPPTPKAEPRRAAGRPASAGERHGRPGEGGRRPEAGRRPERRANGGDRPAPSRAPASGPREESPVDTAKACAEAQSLLRQLLPLLGLSEVSLTVAWDASQSRVRADLEGAGTELLVEKGARSIESLQFLVTVIVGRRLGMPVAVQVETQGYWRKVEADILDETKRGAEEVKRSGKPYRFEPMEPALRRLVHRALAGDPDVETASEGEGAWRKVVLRPRRGG